MLFDVCKVGYLGASDIHAGYYYYYYDYYYYYYYYYNYYYDDYDSSVRELG